MSVASSPLRYPGGKASLLEATSNLLKLNGLRHGCYAEPFAGGCGLALGLLFGGHVSEIFVNDVDVGVWAFWHSILNLTAQFIEKIENTEVTIDEWKRQKNIQCDREGSSSLKLGFSTFFMNRTNRSGIIKGAGMIGGVKQDGSYTLDCRYNKAELIRRISRIAKYRNQIHLYNLDAEKFLQVCGRRLPRNTLLFVDPPYFKKGADLYTSFYTKDDHRKLAAAIGDLRFPWIVTYDNAVEIRILYNKFRQFNFDLKYSVQTKRTGTEVLIISNNIQLPEAFKARELA